MPVELPDFRVAARHGVVRLVEWQPWPAGADPLPGEVLDLPAPAERRAATRCTGCDVRLVDGQPEWRVERRPEDERRPGGRFRGVGATEGA